MMIAAAVWSFANLCCCLSAVHVADTEVRVLENEFVRLEVAPEHGTILRLVDKVSQLDLHSPPELAENFRLLLALPDEPANYVLGKDQTLTKAEAAGERLTLQWDGPLQDAQGRSYAIQAAMTITLAGPAVAFQFRLENHTDRIVQEVWCPAIGGLFDFGSPEVREKSTLNPPPHHAKQLRRPFGAYSANYPGQNMGYVEISNPAIGRSLYVGSHDPIARFKTFHFVETGEGDASNLVFHLTHYPSIPAGGRFESGPVVVQFHAGDWIDGGKTIYRPWFVQTFGSKTATAILTGLAVGVWARSWPGWARRSH